MTGTGLPGAPEQTGWLEFHRRVCHTALVTHHTVISFGIIIDERVG